MSGQSAERIVALLEPGDDPDALQAECAERGLSLQPCSRADEVLLAVSREWPRAVLLPLGESEEESVLLSRALRKRAEARDQLLTILLVVRGGTLVESTEEARDAGADYLIPNLTVSDLLARIEELLTGNSGEDADPIIVVAEGFEEPGEDAAAGHELDGVSSQLDAARAKLPQVRRKLDEVRFANYFTILGVSRNAPTEAIAAAVLSLRRRFDPRHAHDPRLKEVLEEILDGIEDAWLVLGDSRLRRRYRDNLPPTGTNNSS